MFNIEIYAHRAGRGLAAENTLEACRACLAFEIDFIDFDICMTREGELVVTHDPLLNPDITRRADGSYITEKIEVNQLNFEELSRYNVGKINPASKYASYFPEQKSYDFAGIPRLEEAIRFVKKAKPGVKFQLEIKKNHSPEILAEALHRLLKEEEILGVTEVQSFDYNCLFALQKRDSQIKTAFLSHPFEEEKLEGSYPQMVHNLGGHCWEPFQMDLTEESLEEAKRLGLKVVVWGYPEKEGTEFNRAHIEKLASWGVDGIITDRPDLIRERLC